MDFSYQLREFIPWRGKRAGARSQLTNVVFQPIHVVRLDERTGNLFILAGREEKIEVEIKASGEL